MPTYCAQCPQCLTKTTYVCKISEKESALPLCSTCKDGMGKPLAMAASFIPNEGGFILKGTGWHKPGGFN